MSQYSYTSYKESSTAQEADKKSSQKRDYPRVGYFKLNAEKPSAIVRFDVATPDDLVIADVHNIKVGTQWRNVACLRASNEPWNKCPLCEKSIKTRRTCVFVRMLEYSIVDGKVVATPVVWTRYSSFADELVLKLNDYGDLRECLFKVTQLKENGKTTYTVNYQPEKGMYTEDMGYVKDFSAFKGFLVNKHSFMERTFDELTTFVKTGEMASRKPATETKKEEPEKTEDVKTAVAVDNDGVVLEHPAVSSEDIPVEDIKREARPSETTSDEDTPLMSRKRKYTEFDGDSFNSPF